MYDVGLSQRGSQTTALVNSVGSLDFSFDRENLGQYGSVQRVGR